MMANSNAEDLGEAHLRARMDLIGKQKGIMKVVGLKDLHMGGAEAPTSSAYSSQEFIYPMLSSNVINCGFMLMKTGLQEKEITQGVLEKFGSSLTKKHRQNFYKPTSHSVEGILTSGAEYIIESQGMDRGILDAFENKGNMYRDKVIPFKLNQVVPPWGRWRELQSRNLPLPSLSGNHFLELQVVGDISDQKVAKKMGLSEGDVVLFLHGDYTLTSLINYHYAMRLKQRARNSGFRLATMFSAALIYQLIWGGPKSVIANWNSHFGRDLFRPFDVNSRLGERYICANNLAMNYGYGNRLLAFQFLSKTMEKVLPHSNSELIWDVSHESHQLSIDKKQWISRKGASVCIPGKPVLVAGHSDIDSFIGIGAAEKSEYLNSYDHGTSSIIERESPGWSVAGRETLKFDIQRGRIVESQPHRSRRPIELVADHLEEIGMCRKVAFTSPLAGFKEYHGTNKKQI